MRLVTLEDVAQSAGVSRATVSVVLNNKKSGNTRVGDSTREKVISAAKELGYVPNESARELRSGNNSTIAIFTYENIFPVDSMSEFYGFFAGAQEESAKNGYDLLILNNRPSSRLTSASGALMIGLSRDDEDLRTLLKRNYPLVFTGRRQIADIKTDWVTFDYDEVIRQFVQKAAEYSLDGHLIVLFEEGKMYEPDEDKKKFLSEASLANGLELCRLPFSDKPELKEAVLSSSVVFIERLSFIDHFVLWCEKHNLKIGKDVHALVLEDDWQGKYGAWTRWENRRRALGALAVQALLHRIEPTRFPECEKFLSLPPVWTETF